MRLINFLFLIFKKISALMNVLEYVLSFLMAGMG